jgi:hypothetical protein
MSSLGRKRKRIERAGSRAQVPLGQMQVNGSDFEIAVSEQDLYSAQVGAGFKKMGRETMAQGVGMNAPVVEASAFGSNLAGRPEDLGGDGVTCCVPAVAGKEPLLGLAP